jgi:hypothetical protein
MKNDKKMNENSVPLLDLAPRLKRPLSLWNPLDYVRLLYWALFFPQATGWYVNEFGKPGYRYIDECTNGIDALRNDPVQRRLVLQALIAVIITVSGVAWVLSVLGVPISWLALTIGVVFGVLVSVEEGVTFSVAGGVVFGVAGGVTGGVAIVVVFIIAIIASIFRFFESIILKLLKWSLIALEGMRKFYRQPSRMEFLGLSGQQQQLQTWLTQDWQAGLHNVNELLAYTMQFIPVVKAINTALKDSPLELLLERTAALTDGPYDWKLIRYGSASLDNELRENAISGFFLLFSMWRRKRRRKFRYSADLRLDTPARAACAGFWYWHDHEADKAAEAFAVVKDLPHGLELFGIARSIVEGQNVIDLKTIAEWEQGSLWLDELPSTVLRPCALEALRTLRSVASEARVVLHSEAPLNRSTAIGRANAALTLLIDKDETSCQQPEWPLIKEIAEKWRDIFSKAGGIIGEDVLRQPVLNPYEGYSGLPVIGSTFVGRADIMRQIENHWATSGQPASIILYGHRRMGKTSILRNLANRTDANMLFVYLNMQDAGWVDHTGQLLLDFAEAVHRTAVKAGLQAGPPPDEAGYTNLGTGRRAFNALLDRLNPQMTGSKRLVMAIDEFELIETGIQKEKIDAGLLPYLRAINQEYQWLGLIFAGLHTLDEMGRDYQSAFFGQAEYIRVGFLTYEDALRLITQPHPDFALEYTPELRDELYRLTYGQPYLLQRLCWEMVTRWNERFLKQGETTPRTLTLDDLAMALTPDLYLSAGYYFDGVWTNVTENERILMHIMAEREKSTWTIVELAQAVANFPIFREPQALEETLQLLRRHDVILEEKGGLRIASELTRRWISLQRNEIK